jgi:cerevisin
MVKSTLTLALFVAATFAATTEPHASGGHEHIVIFDNSQPITPEINEVLTRLELTEDHPDVSHVFKNSAFRGFSASMQSHCLDLLANMTDISIVERTASVQSAYAVPKQRRDATIDTRGHAPWGLNRISTAAFSAHDPKDMDYTYNFVNSDLGQGSDVYIVDTGLYEDHVVFGGRAKQIWSFDKSNEITDGHGTHVAGTAAGETLGVASKANIFGVRTLAGDGSEGWSSNVVAGIDFVLQQHEARKANADFKGSVLSMSLASAGKVDAIDKALDAAIKAGVHVVVAAGNAGTDACAGSPASAGGTHGPAIVVGSVGISGDMSSFSNHGECVDVYAPGEDIISAWIGAPDVVNVLSGTSMATPHVTGIVAYAMANSTLANSPGLMKEWIRMQGLPRGDGTVLANNGVWASGDSGTKAMVSPNTIESAATKKHKRSLGESAAPPVAMTFLDDTTDLSSSSSSNRLTHHYPRSQANLVSRRENPTLRSRSLKDFLRKLKNQWKHFWNHDPLLCSDCLVETKKRSVTSSLLDHLDAKGFFRKLKNQTKHWWSKDIDFCKDCFWQKTKRSVTSSLLDHLDAKGFFRKLKNQTKHWWNHGNIDNIVCGDDCFWQKTKRSVDTPVSSIPPSFSASSFSSPALESRSLKSSWNSFWNKVNNQATYYANRLTGSPKGYCIDCFWSPKALPKDLQNLSHRSLESRSLKSSWNNFWKKAGNQFQYGIDRLTGQPKSYCADCFWTPISWDEWVKMNEPRSS